MKEREIIEYVPGRMDLDDRDAGAILYLTRTYREVNSRYEHATANLFLNMGHDACKAKEFSVMRSAAYIALSRMH